MRSAVNGVIDRTAATRPAVLHVALLAALLFFFSMLALPVAAQQTEPGAFSEDQLEAFAAASLRVQELSNKWQPQIAEAPSPEDGNAMRQQAMGEMTEAVREEGLSVEEYNTIHDTALRDPQVMTVIQEYQEELR
ncbi:MAG: DUF4168 domain-containing protein [Kiloniellaceae bacterium]|nr:DUF4168 domain-containing protein [Kiloniellaceae bacterium]